MIIGQVGWSGRQNWGDERILCSKVFKDDEIRPFTMWQENIKKLDQLIFILIGGGGLISRGFSYYTDQLSKLKNHLDALASYRGRSSIRICVVAFY
jgi:hypothetical protein